MGYKSRGVAQSYARNVQYERCRQDHVYFEQGKEPRQNIMKHADRPIKGVIKIRKETKKLLGI